MNKDSSSKGPEVHFEERRTKPVLPVLCMSKNDAIFSLRTHCDGQLAII